MAQLAVFVALLAFASAVPLDNTISVLPASGSHASVLPALDASGVASINDDASISNLPAAPGISFLPGVVDESNQVVEIAVEHDASPCAACFQYMSKLIDELTSSVGAIPIEIVAEPEEPVALPADTSDSVVGEAVALPGQLPGAVVIPEVGGLQRPAVIKDIIF